MSTNRHNSQVEPPLYGGFTDLRKQGEPSVTLATIQVGQGDTSSESGQAQRYFVTGSLRDRQRVGRLTQGRRIGQQRPTGNRERVREVDHSG